MLVFLVLACGGGPCHNVQELVKGMMSHPTALRLLSHLRTRIKEELLSTPRLKTHVRVLSLSKDTSVQGRP